MRKCLFKFVKKILIWILSSEWIFAAILIIICSNAIKNLHNNYILPIHCLLMNDIYVPSRLNAMKTVFLVCAYFWQRLSPAPYTHTLTLTLTLTLTRYNITFCCRQLMHSTSLAVNPSAPPQKAKRRAANFNAFRNEEAGSRGSSFSFTLWLKRG